MKVKSALIWSAVLMRKEEKRDRPMGILPWPYFFKDFEKHQIIFYNKKEIGKGKHTTVKTSNWKKKWKKKSQVRGWKKIQWLDKGWWIRILKRYHSSKYHSNKYHSTAEDEREGAAWNLSSK